MKRQIIAFSLLVLGPALAAAGQNSPISAQAELALRAPTTQSAEYDNGTGRFYKVSNPTLLVWPAPAEKANGTAVIVCPGGSYDHVTMNEEGQRVARWLNPMGITVFGLKYRTKPPSTDVAADALADGEVAVRLIRNSAEDWKVRRDAIGMLGYSAGANLVLNVAANFDEGIPTSTDPVERQSSRPDFVVLLSTWPNRLTIDAFPLKPTSPPAFIAIARDDRTAPPPFSAAIKQKLDELKVPARLYEAERGGHSAFHLDGNNADAGWREPLLAWMRENRWLGE